MLHALVFIYHFCHIAIVLQELFTSRHPYIKQGYCMCLSSPNPLHRDRKLCEGNSVDSAFFVQWFIVNFMCIRLLNDNLLDGRVPEQLYSIGVHGGAIEYVIVQFDLLHCNICLNLDKAVGCCYLVVWWCSL